MFDHQMPRTRWRSRIARWRKVLFIGAMFAVAASVFWPVTLGRSERVRPATGVQPWAPFPKDVVLLIDGRVDNDCLSDMVYRVSAGAALPLQLVSGDPECPAEAELFAKDEAVAVAVVPQWFTFANYSLNLEGLLLRPPVVVHLNVWVPGGKWTCMIRGQPTLAPCSAWAAATIDLARSHFHQNRVGIALEYDMSQYTAGQADTIGNGCDHVPILKKESSLYKAGFINVYYVDLVTGWKDPDKTYLGYNCSDYQDDAGRPDADVIYVSLSEGIDTNLSHELGHALGLQRSVGHVDLKGSFTELQKAVNIMTSSVDASNAIWHAHLTLGQVYRMNIDRWSWINRADWTGVAARSGWKKWCQEHWAAGICPELSLEWP